MQQRVDLDFQASPPVASYTFQVLPFLCAFQDVRLLVLELIEIFEIINMAVLLWFGTLLVALTAQNYLAEDKAAIHDGVARTQDGFFDIVFVNVCVPSNNVLLTFVVHVDQLLEVVFLDRFGLVAESQEIGLIRKRRFLRNRRRSSNGWRGSELHRSAVWLCGCRWWTHLFRCPFFGQGIKFVLCVERNHRTSCFCLGLRCWRQEAEINGAERIKFCGCFRLLGWLLECLLRFCGRL
mmetsp:Transcript_28371/g.74884  ORF Transcript_28371/g.74884 Transcript_28371/m.74884 type:complete len:237 (-) Transcript_28371:597-1307(-)